MTTTNFFNFLRHRHRWLKDFLDLDEGFLYRAWDRGGFKQNSIFFNLPQEKT